MTARPTPLTRPQLEALATLCSGPARRTTGRTRPGHVNRQAVLALCRRGLAMLADKGVYEATDKGRRWALAMQCGEVVEPADRDTSAASAARFHKLRRDAVPEVSR